MIQSFKLNFEDIRALSVLTWDEDEFTDEGRRVDKFLEIAFDAVLMRLSEMGGWHTYESLVTDRMFPLFRYVIVLYDEDEKPVSKLEVFFNYEDMTAEVCAKEVPV